MKFLKNKKIIVLIITALLGAVGFKVSQSEVESYVAPLLEEKAEVAQTPQAPRQDKEQPTHRIDIPQEGKPAVEYTPSAPPEHEGQYSQEDELEHQQKQGTFDQETTTQQFNKASAISDQRRVHILMGDRTGGGHMFGAGKPCKSEFPSDWDEDKIIETIDLIAANDNASWEKQRNGYHVSEQMVEGVKVRVVKGRQNESVITAYPLNTGRNPCPANDN